MSNGSQLVPASFRSKAIAFPAKVDAFIARNPTIEDTQEGVSQGKTLQVYLKEIGAANDVLNPVNVGILKLKAHIGKQMPREAGGRGKKALRPGAGLSNPHTISDYRKLADNAEKLDEYFQECTKKDDKPVEQSDFLEWCGANPKKTVTHVSQNTGVPEWYTPTEYIEAARKVLGEIDLDPASSDKAQETVQATDYLTISDDGLMHDWKGRVWMNPPYASGLIDKFMLRLKQHYDNGDVKAAITLTNNATDTAWFQSCSTSCVSICLVAKRIKYLDETGEPKNSPLQGQVFMYFGRSAAKFGKQFEQFGSVWVKR